MARIADVVKQRFSTHFTGVIDDYVAKTQQPLGNTRRNRDILNLAQGNVSGCARHQSGINLNLRIGQRVANHVAA